MLTIYENIADKKENVSIQKEFHRHCAGSPITGMTAYVMAAFADALAEKYVSAVGEMVAFDVQLDQQSKNVKDIAKSFVSTHLLTFSFQCWLLLQP